MYVSASTLGKSNFEKLLRLSTETYRTFLGTREMAASYSEIETEREAREARQKEFKKIAANFWERMTIKCPMEPKQNIDLELTGDFFLYSSSQGEEKGVSFKIKTSGRSLFMEAEIKRQDRKTNCRGSNRIPSSGYVKLYPGCSFSGSVFSRDQ